MDTQTQVSRAKGRQCDHVLPPRKKRQTDQFCAVTAEAEVSSRSDRHGPEVPLRYDAHSFGSGAESYFNRHLEQSRTTAYAVPTVHSLASQTTSDPCFYSSDTHREPLACAVLEHSRGLEDICHTQAPCGAPAPPCTNPDCDDGLPCPLEENLCCDADCDKELCFDEECLSKYINADICYDEQCSSTVRCASPCFNQDCKTSMFSDVYPTMAPPPLPDRYGQRFRAVPCAFSTRQSDLCSDGCVNPDCLSRTSSTPVSGSQVDSVAEEHYPSSESYEVMQTGNCFSTSRLLSDFPHMSDQKSRHDNSESFDPNHRHGSKDVVEQFLQKVIIPPIDTNLQNTRETPQLLKHTTPTPDLAYSVRNTPTPLSSQVGYTAATPDEGVICRWINATCDAPCGQVFESPEDLHHHVEKQHIDDLPREDNHTDGNGFLCRWLSCERYMFRSFRARPKLKRHMQTHTLWKPFTCAQCGAQMKTKDAMEKHERIHSGEKPYQCLEPDCGKSFATSTELKTHKVVHSGAKPHKCPYCEESFADSSNLSKHKKTHFLGMYRCPICNARMKRWDQLRRHLVTQSHALELIAEGKAQKEYKSRMEREFKALPENARMQSVGRTPAKSRGQTYIRRRGPSTSPSLSPPYPNFTRCTWRLLGGECAEMGAGPETPGEDWWCIKHCSLKGRR